MTRKGGISEDFRETHSQNLFISKILCKIVAASNVYSVAKTIIKERDVTLQTY